MKRRDFLKLLGITPLALLLPKAARPEAPKQAFEDIRMFRPDDVRRWWRNPPEMPPLRPHWSIGSDETGWIDVAELDSFEYTFDSREGSVLTYSRGGQVTVIEKPLPAWGGKCWDVTLVNDNCAAESVVVHCEIDGKAVR